LARTLAFLLGGTLATLAGLPAAAEGQTSRYTPLGSGACSAPPLEIAESYAARDLGVEECPAPTPYRLFVVSSDAHSWVDLRRNNCAWSTEQRAVYGKDMLAVGHFPNVRGADVGEWRLGKNGEPVALIVRLWMVDPAHDGTAGATISRLMVIGLRADDPCDLGLAVANDEGRRLADAAPASCSAPLPH